MDRLWNYRAIFKSKINDDDAGEDNFLTARGVELGNDFWVVSTALEILEFWFLGFHDMVLIIN